MFNSIDVDGGGTLDFEEFSGWWESPAGKAFRDGQRDWKQQGEAAEAAAAAEQATAAEQVVAGMAEKIGASKPSAGHGEVGSGGGPMPGSPDFVANWVMSGGAVGAPGSSPGPPDDQPEEARVMTNLLAAAKAEKTAPLKYQEKKELLKRQRKAEEDALKAAGMTHSEAMKAAVAVAGKTGERGVSDDDDDDDDAEPKVSR